MPQPSATIARYLLLLRKMPIEQHKGASTAADGNGYYSSYQTTERKLLSIAVPVAALAQSLWGLIYC